MEQSAFEAVMLGVNVFVFIMAVTAGIFLMSNVINMVNFANEAAIIGMNGNLAETVGVVNKREYTGSQLIVYYNKIEEDKLPEYDIRVRLNKYGQDISIKQYIKTEDLNSYFNKNFEMQYKGKIGGKFTYVFKEVNS